MGKHTRGFTLIELLVVIAIIAILASILFPVFAQARMQGYKAQCSSNMRQVALAIEMYTGDNDNTYPRGEFWDYNQPYNQSYLWSSALCVQRYIKGAGVEACPVDKFTKRQDSDYNLPANRQPHSISVLANSFAPWHPQLGIQNPRGYMPLMDIRYSSTDTISSTKGSAVVRPAETILLCEGKYEYYDKMYQCGRWLQDEIDWCYNAGGAGISEQWQVLALVLAPEAAPWYNAWRKHAGGTNVAFGDTHIKHVKAGLMNDPRLWFVNVP